MDELVNRIGALFLVLLVTAVAGLVLTRRQGRVRAADGVLGADELGGSLGPAATLVQFSTAICSACPPTRRVLGSTARSVPGVVHLEVDAERRPDLVRRLAVRSTPTTFVLDGAGRVSARLTGAPSPRQVHEALALAGVGATTAGVTTDEH